MQMHDYEVTDNQTGKVYTITGDRPPTESEVQDLIISTLPQASIAERGMANALFTGDENARKAYLMQRGKNPNEPGMFTSPRETLADVVESAGPAAKLAGQIGGEALGTPFGVAGIAGGGGLGRSAVQTGVEGLADVTGMGIPGGNERVAKEGAIGAITSLGGQVLAKGVPKVISMINDKFPLVKKSEEFMLTNITRMSKGMQDWVKGRWTDVYNTAQDPLRELTLKVNSGIIDPIRRIRTDFGKQLTAAKLDAFMNAVRPDFTGLASTIK